LERCSTGVTGFDDLVEGGFPKGSMILLTGSPGTGKTIFGLQYIYNGAMNGENGVYVCIESTPEALKKQAENFGMDFERLEKEGKVIFYRVPTDDRKFGIFKKIFESVEKIHAKRMVFDSLATLNIILGRFVSLWDYETSSAASSNLEKMRSSNINSFDMMVIANSIIEQLRPIGTTTLLITYGSENPGSMAYDEASEFLCDGIIDFYNLPIGIKYSRSMRIGKMRSTNNSQYIHEFRITDKGIVVSPAEAILFNE
jgi:KaiC/GvpD/RAD55 family RecA-like ATPase